jgi:hypothetical protein
VKAVSAILELSEMTPVDQEFMHDPANGVYGDCMRAAIASLLDLPREEVPHFHEGTNDVTVFDRRVNAFLASKGLMLVDVTPSEYIFVTNNNLPDCYHLISGYTERGTYHACVGKNGELVHDPHPSKAGVLEHDRWGFLVRTGS